MLKKLAGCGVSGALLPKKSTRRSDKSEICPDLAPGLDAIRVLQGCRSTYTLDHLTDNAYHFEMPRMTIYCPCLIVSKCSQYFQVSSVVTRSVASYFISISQRADSVVPPSLQFKVLIGTSMSKHVISSHLLLKRADHLRMLSG